MIWKEVLREVVNMEIRLQEFVGDAIGVREQIVEHGCERVPALKHRAVAQRSFYKESLRVAFAEVREIKRASGLAEKTSPPRSWVRERCS